MDEKVLTALASGLVGGAIGSAITAFTNLTLWRRQQRTEASKVLWNYHYYLSAGSAKAFESISDEPGQSTLLEGGQKEIKVALRNAYPYAGYLSRSARDILFRNAGIDLGDYREDADYRYAKHLGELAELLENELDWTFPRRSGDGLRVLFRQWRERHSQAKEARDKIRMKKLMEKRKARKQSIRLDTTEQSKPSADSKPISEGEHGVNR